MAKKDLNNAPRVTDNGEIDLSPERAFAVKRTGKQVAKLQQRIKITKWIVISLLLLVIILYLMFIFIWRGGLDGEGGGDKPDYGDFTVQIDEGNKNLISLSEDIGFENGTIRLKGTSADDLWHCTRDWIPDNIQDLSEGGAHHSDDPSYFAYTFYLKNCSDEEVIYTYDLELIDKYIASELDALDAVRVMFVRNGDKSVWAKSSVDGTPIEPNTFIFSTEPYMLEQKDNVIAGGAVDKYTIVMWLEGEDPECINDIWTNQIEFQMNFEVQNKFKESIEDTSSETSE